MRNRIGMRWKRWTQDKWTFGGWLVLGLGLVLLAASIPFSIWLIQRSGESNTVSGQNGTVLASGTRGDTASFGDSARLEIRRASSPDAVVVVPVDEGDGEAEPISAEDVASIQDATTVVISTADVAEQYIAGPIGDVATFSDAATLSITEIPVVGLVQEDPPAGAATNFSDIAQFVVRDSDGNIKSQGVIE